MSTMMKAAVFVEPGRIEIVDKRIPDVGPNEALIAAHALALDATLVSADAEFLRVPGLRVENWLDAKIEA